MKFEDMDVKKRYADGEKRQKYLDSTKEKYSDSEADEIEKTLKKIDELSETDNKYEDSIASLAYFEEEERRKEEAEFLKQFPEFNPKEPGISKEEKEKREKIISKHLSRIGDRMSDMKMEIIGAERDKYIDELTGLKNKNAFLKEIPEAINLAMRNDKPFVLIMSDLDKFKDLNDAYGHSAGDKVLQEVALSIKSSMRESFFVYRFGGEEVAVFVAGCDEERGRVIAEKIRSKVEELTIKTRDNDGKIVEIKQTISIGYVSSDLIPGYLQLKEEIKQKLEKNPEIVREKEFKKTLEEKLKEVTKQAVRGADSALYQSKLEGRNKTSVYRQKKIEIL